jgi:hypothetical protein
MAKAALEPVGLGALVPLPAVPLPGTVVLPPAVPLPGAVVLPGVVVLPGAVVLPGVVVLSSRSVYRAQREQGNYELVLGISTNSHEGGSRKGESGEFHDD